jgi:hypothetical protein
MPKKFLSIKKMEHVAEHHFKQYEKKIDVMIKILK